jgi:dTDP-glucose pyrophosphorylase
MLDGILADGLGTRPSEYAEARPKRMMKIGGQPLHWHLIKIHGRRVACASGIVKSLSQLVRPAECTTR